jgi:hypothetical protein
MQKQCSLQHASQYAQLNSLKENSLQRFFAQPKNTQMSTYTPTKLNQMYAYTPTSSLPAPQGHLQLSKFDKTGCISRYSFCCPETAKPCTQKTASGGTKILPRSSPASRPFSSIQTHASLSVPMHRLALPPSSTARRLPSQTHKGRPGLADGLCNASEPG